MSMYQGGTRAASTRQRRALASWPPPTRSGSFAIDTDDDELTLRWDGPPAAGELVDRLHRYLIGNEPIDVLAGLL